VTTGFEVTAKRGMRSRFFTVRVGAMLARNTVASTLSFLLGLALMWVLVREGGTDEVLATGLSFLFAQTLQYVLGRLWVFKGTDRAVGMGYVIFLVNAAMGLAITVSLFALLMRLLPMHFIAARIIVSVFAGLAMFVVNATFNFRRV
jgi:putative flippase GtrA